MRKPYTCKNAHHGGLEWCYERDGPYLQWKKRVRKKVGPSKTRPKTRKVVQYRAPSLAPEDRRKERWVKIAIRSNKKHGYAVSQFGRVRRVEANDKDSTIVAPDWHKRGLRVRIGYKGKRQSRFIHHLVRLYHTDIPLDVEIRFKDGNKWNPRADNLTYRVSRKLTKRKVYWIKLNLKAGASMYSLAKQYGVDVGTIKRIRDGTAWGDVQADIESGDGRLVQERRKNAR